MSALSSQDLVGATCGRERSDNKMHHKLLKSCCLASLDLGGLNAHKDNHLQNLVKHNLLWKGTKISRTSAQATLGVDEKRC